MAEITSEAPGPATRLSINPLHERVADDLRARFPGLEQSPHAAVQGG